MIKTLLGSCVALVFWHKELRIGAMCHYVLPSRGKVLGGDPAPSGRYADEFMQLFLEEIRRRELKTNQFQLRAYGAANMFQKLKITCADENLSVDSLCVGCSNVSCRNRQVALSEAKQHGFELLETDLGGIEHRYVEFNVATGSVVVRKMQPIESA